MQKDSKNPGTKRSRLAPIWRLLFVGIFVLPLLGLPLALAEDKTAAQPCVEFRIKFCGTLKNPSPELTKCMASHRADFSPACLQRMDRTAPCLLVINKVCTNVSQNTAAHVDCMIAHKAEIPAPCARFHEDIKVFWAICKDSIKKHCPAPPWPNLATCLRGAKADLTPECLKILESFPKIDGPPTPATALAPAPNVHLPPGLSLPTARPPVPVQPLK
jgi:hypothetical protein